MPEPRRLLGSAEVSLQAGADVGQEASRQASAARGDGGWDGRGRLGSQGKRCSASTEPLSLFHLNPLCLFIHERPSYLQSEIFLTSLARLFPSEDVPGVIEPAPSLLPGRRAFGNATLLVLAALPPRAARRVFLKV